ncbi:outer membrane beta-barrel protein [Sphingomonas solaris]|uniref:Porin family protein n=1 Tax=Alterirhizorhabdus solaris TaxID=2529389 RepID=A0A558QTN0_9SPHN|nr:outer membrane beta-barrel protein [Sphingomonas solaris]TVV70493.1 porin family protein [Sphingomonas solaris]
MTNSVWRRAALMAAALVAVPGAARAEGFIDVYAGRSSAEARSLTIRADEAQVNGAVVPADLRVRLFDVKTTKETLYGARAGYWFGRNVGVAVDVSTLDPDVRAQTLNATANLAFDETVFDEPVTIDAGERRTVTIPKVTVPTTATIAALAMVRLPLGGEGVAPSRRIAPYAFAGPVWLVTDPSLDGNLGLRAGGGVRVPVAGGIALFAEYRYTRGNADAVAGRVSGTVQGISARSGDIRVDIPIRNPSGVAGLSLSL